MLWAPLLHIYQPPTQFRQVLRKIAKDSYFKIIEILKRNKNAKLTLNICASLTEQLGQEFPRIISELKELANLGQIELTGSAAYHPLLSKLPKVEIERQIKLNAEINKKYFGKAWKTLGFFPPEMAYSPQVGNVLEELGFSWVLLEEFAYPVRDRDDSTYPVRDRDDSTYPGVHIGRDKLFKRKGKNLFVFFRERGLSLKIAFAQINSVTKLEKYLGEGLAKNGYLITAMDGETFGHYQKGQDKFLGQLYNFGKLPSIKISELFEKFTEIARVEPLHSTWGISEEDCRAGRIYPRWDLPGNPIHKLQWQLTNLAVRLVNNKKIKAKTKQFLKARKLLDKALHSDQYWWASHNPNWHYKMVVKGAQMFSGVVQTLPLASKPDKLKAENLKKEIAKLGLKLYGDTIIDR